MVITIFCSWNLQKPQSIVKKRLDIDLMDEASKHVGNTIFQKACNKWKKSTEQNLIFCFQVCTDVSITFSKSNQRKQATVWKLTILASVEATEIARNRQMKELHSFP